MTNKDEYLIKQLDDILTCLGKQIGGTLEMDKFTKMTNEVDPYDKDGFKYDSQMRINIIGFFAQGKSTLTRRLLGQSLDNITCTDGIEVYVQKLKMQGSAWTTCDTMDIYEECSRRMVDITNREHVFPLESIGDDSVDETINEPEDGEKQTFTHGTNKTQTSAHTYSNTGPVHKLVDKKFSQIAKDQEKELQRRFLNHLRDDKDCNDQDVLLANIWDFGGQFIYYATHQIFHSKDAIYLLVFDLTKDLDAIIIDCDFPDRQEKMRNSLLFWVNSIQAYVGCDTSRENVKPTIILVGTHKDKLQGDVSLKFQEVFDLFAGTKFSIHIHEKPFAVASLDKDDKGIQNLKRTIYELGLKNARHAKIPANWIPLELAMLRVRDEKMKQILEMKDIIALDTLNTHPILDKNEIKKFLNYHHAKGTFVFFDEEGLDKYIVLNPQFIIDAFRCIISAKWFCRWSQTVQINATKLKREAILERDLLDTVWSENRFTAFKDILLLFLEKHRILAELRRMDENTGNIQLLGKYMIPSLLNPELDLHETNDFLQNKEYTSIVLGLELEGLISTTVFEKCTAALLGKCPPIEYNDQVLVSQHEGLYRLDLQHARLIQKSGENIELMVINLCPPEHPKSTTCDRFRRYVEMVLTFEKCKSHLRQEDVKPYRHYIKCNDSQHAGRGSHNIHYLNKIRNQPKVCCPDNRSHPIYVQEAIAEWFLEEGITDFETSIIRKTSKKDKLVSRVAREFGINWKMFGIAIGLSFEDLKLISDKCDQVKETNILIISMFDVWRKKYPDDSDYMHGRENQIEENTDVIVDWDKVRNCFDSN
ncbi:uncharacterized protein LOC132757552 [Ruditapes philippinarum]|uniref:uncharacterized protein LOC132757552 n=1 Tax=Ruditapes philippinarum TaxID=129788 RepID=UPI00295AC8AE|nr:uncharacterized protein LOC132757552 [Ruditapes philippinarum]